MERIKWFLSGLSILVAGVIALAVALTIISMITAALARTILAPPTCCIDEGVINKVATWAYGSPLKIDNRAESEFRAANINSDQIQGWVAQCTAVGLADPKVHSRVMAEFGVDGDQYANNSSNLLTQDSVLPAARQIRFLSDTLLRSRAENAINVARAYTILQIGTWSAIAIGFVTTILVSLSSTEFGQGQSTASRTIRILAVALPALGTAVAAVIAFYSPREDLARSSQALAGVRQIHDQMAIEIGAVPCPVGEDAREIMAKLESWKKGLRDVKSLAEAAALAAVDQTSSQSTQGKSAQQGAQADRP